MSTRSLIGKVQPNGKIKAVYCHYDGYPSYNGVVLDTHYTDPRKVDMLISCGGFSALDADIHKISFYTARGEELEIREFDDLDAYVDDPDQWDIEYYYLFNDNHWSCYEPGGREIPRQEWENN